MLLLFNWLYTVIDAFLAMSLVTEDRLKSVVFDCLSKFDSLKDISLKKVKTQVSDSLGVSLDLINEKYAADVKKCISEYRKRQKTGSKDDLVHGRFSKKESAMILRAVEEFAEENHIDPTEVSSFFREKKNTREYNGLWDSLIELLPHRSKKVIA